MTFPWLGSLVVNKETDKSDTEKDSTDQQTETGALTLRCHQATLLAASGHAPKAYTLTGSAYQVGWALERLRPNLPAPHLLPGTSWCRKRVDSGTEVRVPGKWPCPAPPRGNAGKGT